MFSDQLRSDREFSNRLTYQIIAYRPCAARRRWVAIGDVSANPQTYHLLPAYLRTGRDL